MNYKESLQKVVEEFRQFRLAEYGKWKIGRADAEFYLTATYKAAYLAGLEAGKGCKSEFPDVLSRIMNEQQLEAAKAAWEVSVSSSCEAITTLQEEIEKI